MQEIVISNRKIGKNHPPFIIAELSGNHNQSLDRAIALVEAAAAAGVDAIKLQTYTADTMTIKGVCKIEDTTSLWKGKELHELYQQAHTPWEWHATIFAKAKALGLIAFSSPFDSSAVDFLETLKVPAYKIASFENTDHPLLTKVAQTGKPVIMSTGASRLSEIDEAVEVLRNNGCKELILLKCTSTYPASAATSNLKTIPHLEELFQNTLVGLSDHTLGVGVSIAAIALGATVIEKHLTIRRADGGVDSAFSLEPQEMQLLVEEGKKAFLALGQVQYGIQASEQKSRLFKRSIYAAQDIAVGERFTQNNLRVIRPGDGLAPKHLNHILGKVAKVKISGGTPMNWKLL